MNLRDALQKVGQILDEERIHPTVSYQVSKATLKALGDTLGTFYYLFAQKDRGKQHPRVVRENPEEYQFQSINFDLLCTVFDQVQEQDRPGLFASMRSRILDAKSYLNKATGLGAGSWAKCSSELPLVAEFHVRRGDKQLLIDALFEAAISPGLTLLLLQIEEMIALNFTLFTQQEYAQIRSAMEVLRSAVHKLNDKPTPANTIASNTRFHLVREIPELCTSISEECRKATYLHTKGSLLTGMNLEVNQDKGKVQTFLEKLGFTQLLIESLDEAEKLYRTAATPFELKSCLGHLRSFVEQLHLQACVGVHNKFGGVLPSRWGEALKYLLDKQVLTKQEWQVFGSLYTLVSDTGVHPLIADREYARLMRNMSIECGLLVLTKLDKLGVSLVPKSTASVGP